MCEGEAQRSVAAHRDAGDGPAFSARTDAIPALDCGNEFLEKEITVAQRVVWRVDVESALAFWRYYQKVIDLVLAAQVFNYAPSAGAEECLFVLTETVQEIQHRIAARRRSFGVIVRRQLHTVVNCLL